MRKQRSCNGLTVVSLIFFILLLTHNLSASPGLPSRAQRVFALEKAGLTDNLAGLDELDQDLLYFDVQTQTLQQLLTKYPKIRKAKFMKMQSLVKELQ